MSKTTNAKQDAADAEVLRKFLFGKTPPGFVATTEAVEQRLMAYVGKSVRDGRRILTLRARKGSDGSNIFFIESRDYAPRREGEGSQ